VTKVLITGATGFIGRAVADAANKRGIELRLLIRSDKYIDQVKHLKFERVYGDLTDPASLKKACEGVDAVFHVAAMFSMYVRDEKLLYKTNVDGTLAIIQAALDSGVKKIIYTSSVAAIGHRDDGVPSDETVEWNLDWTNDPYVKSKHLACVAVKEFIQQGEPVVIIYPAAPIGWGDVKPTPTGQMYVDFINGKIPAYYDGGFSVIDVDDVGEGHLLAYEKAPIGEDYILTNINMSLKELFDLTSEITGVPKIKFKVPVSMAIAMAGLMEWWADRVTHQTPVLTRGGAMMTSLPPFFNGEKAVRELGLKLTPIREALEKAIWFFYEKGMVRKKPVRGEAREEG
jgi:dihydroflavonol-4-reductase